MTNFKRFAVYYAPEPGPLADFGASWLGWDLTNGSVIPHPMIEGLDIAALTDSPRKYGLHGTIKPPFRLAPGADVATLHNAMSDLCQNLAPVTLAGLQLSRLGSFLALTIKGGTSPVDALAARVVKQLDPLRAPLSDAELARRRKTALSPRQEDLLAQWGYPYVMEEFRFHITLTGKIPRPQAETIRQQLDPLLAPILPKQFSVTSLCLVGEDENGMFHLIHRYALQG